MVYWACACIVSPPFGLDGYDHHKGCFGRYVGSRNREGFARFRSACTPRGVDSTVFVVLGPGISAFSFSIDLRTCLINNSGECSRALTVLKDITARGGDNHLDGVGVVDEGRNIGEGAVVCVGSRVGVGGDTTENCIAVNRCRINGNGCSSRTRVFARGVGELSPTCTETCIIAGRGRRGDRGVLDRPLVGDVGCVNV